MKKAKWLGAFKALRRVFSPPVGFFQAGAYPPMSVLKGMTNVARPKAKYR